MKNIKLKNIKAQIIYDSIVDSLVENTEIRLVSHKSFVDGITRIFIGLKYKDQVFQA